ncbi:toxin co-regulated pilus biosynthesis Q family protein [Rahnella perminowiae]|uniref:toxin co-regulated pilus biosynthesis Q family protein n=2 Tax=Rahnella perminowiae TaxID=2816244 RepID=UPI00215C50B2|nr:toxin co-regulated pilus biosynthesis Q family protein [Rahnella perminowiae]MCR8998697.1 toxin co-regulated pilus biosynthesis Q family protein [Rahnella perminowiae]
MAISQQDAVNTTPGGEASLISRQKTASVNEGFVTASGKRVPLYKALRIIVPASWEIQLSPDVAQNFRGTLSWEGNDQWTYVLRKALSAAQLTPVLSEQKKTLMVKFAAPMAAKTPVVKALTPVTSRAASDVKTVPTKKLFSGVVLTPPVVPVIAQPLKTDTMNKRLLLPALPVNPVLPVRPVLPVKPAVRVWTMAKGNTLRQGYEQWAMAERCSGPNGKWSVRWDSVTDYPIDYPLSFTSSDFEAVTAQLFNLYRHAQVPLLVSGYRQQCLIVISDGK